MLQRTLQEHRQLLRSPIVSSEIADLSVGGTTEPNVRGESQIISPSSLKMADIKLIEKGGLIAEPVPTPSRRRRNLLFVLGCAAVFGGIFSDLLPTFPFARQFHQLRHSCGDHTAALATAQCPTQPPAIQVKNDWDPLHDELYAELAARRLSQAVQHETISYDDFVSLPANDTALDKHYVFADWMYNEYPKVFNTLKHEVVNYHGQLLTWQGKNASLQPIILMAHTDVVPVAQDTLGSWTFPPFEGTIATNATKDTPGTWIWGRGASDCKNQLMGILGATERLVSDGFEPERTIIIASGFDEEVSVFLPRLRFATAKR